MFDATALRAITDELNEKILRGRVQEIVQLDALTFGLEIYAAHARHYLFLTAHPEDARVHLAGEKLRGSGEAAGPLLMLLRKYTEGAFVDAVTQLPHERVLQIQFDHAVGGVTTLVVETIGRYSNIILLDAGGRIIDALKRVNTQMNRARTTLPKQMYVPPPPQQKLDPEALDEKTLARVLAKQADNPLWQTLVQNIAGVSPLLAREIAHRVGDAAEPAEILRTLHELTRPPWQPVVALEEDEPAEYAPYPLTQFADTRPFDSPSAAIEAFYGAPEQYSAVKERLRVPLADARNRLARRRDALAQSLASGDEIERLKTSGEMVLAYASQISPGQQVLHAETGDGVMGIPLDAKLSPVENAQKYFKEYHRAKDAAKRVPALLNAANAELEYADQMLNDLELAENRPEIDAVVQAARDAGLLFQERPRAKATASAPREVQSSDGFTVLIGRNAQQNEEITFRRAKPEDMWLHAKDAAGAHVVIVRAGREVPEQTIQEAAALAAHYSQARGETRVDVMITPRKNVHRLRGGRPGMVSVRNSAIVRIVQQVNSAIVG